MDEDVMPDGERSAGPAKAASNRLESRSCRLNSALDLVHLSLQCQGDRELEKGLLGLFRLQSRVLSEQLSDAAMVSPEAKATIAHKLRGSALVVGAGRVARAAEALEEKARVAQRSPCGRPMRRDAVSQAIAVLEAAIAEVVAEIDRIGA